MKNIGKIAVLGAVLAASASFAFGDTLTLGSYSSVANVSPYTPNPGTPAGLSNSAMTFNGVNAVTTFTPPGPGGTASVQQPIKTAGTAAFYEDPTNVWKTPPLASSTWVGPTMAGGPQGTTTSISNNPVQGFYTYSTTFTATGVYNLLLNVLADDTLEVFLNGSSTPLIGFGALVGDGHCAGGVPNCLTTDTFSGQVTLSGLNTLWFVVEQAGDERAADPTGVDFDATLTSTPEPSSLMLLGTGLVGAAGMFFRRRVTA